MPKQLAKIRLDAFQDCGNKVKEVLFAYHTTKVCC